MILDNIAAAVRLRVEEAKQQTSLEMIKSQAMLLPKGNFPFEHTLMQSDMSFICEVKKASPSKGVISPHFPYLQIAMEYEAAGASAISVLTEQDFFLGRPSYLKEIHEAVKTPLLRKDFIIDEYQIYEAKYLGASAVLLICALLNTEVLKQYISICHSLGLSALVEVHDEAEISSALKANARVIGVNNRNLKTFEVDIQNAVRLRALVPANILFVAESGIQTSNDIRILNQAGVNAVLIGETLMCSKNKTFELLKLREGCYDKN